MGIHTGEASEESIGFVGYEVHRAARIAAVGCGGQILLSSSTAGLVEATLSDEIGLRNLGSHRLKDLGRPETIFQIVAEGLPSEFPPLRSLDNPELANNLPVSLSPMIGRNEEMIEVRQLVVESRLVTLTGAGGSGKTRLALQVAAELLDGSGEGVWFVDLAPISDPDQVALSALNTMGMRLRPDISPLASLVQTLKGQNVLIVLDNCEHVIDAVSHMVEAIGRSCSRVTIITTSREPLGVAFEQVYRVRSMSLPPEIVDTLEDLDGSDAVALLLARTHTYDPTIKFQDGAASMIASICRRLDGIPLAIELAASRLSSMSLQDFHERLDQRFRLLTGGSRNALPRQQTLGAMVAWSYDLLDERERRVLRQLSVFVNGFDLKAAETVCASEDLEPFDVADTISSLVNKSLVSAERTTTAVRYKLLETVRQFAADQMLQSDGEMAARDFRERHAAYFFDLGERARSFLDDGPEQDVWMWRCDDDWDNIQSAWRHFVDDGHSREKVLQIGINLRMFLASRIFETPLAWMASALAEAEDLPLALRGNAQATLGYLVMVVSPDNFLTLRALDYFESALQVARQSLDKSLEAEVLGYMAFAARFFSGDNEAGDRLGIAAVGLAKSADDAGALGRALLFRALAASDYSITHEHLLLALAELRRREDLFDICTATMMLGVTWGLLNRDVVAAKSSAMEAMEIAERIGSQFHARILLTNLGVAHFLLGEISESERFNRRALFTARRIGLNESVMSWCVLGMACCATASGEFGRSAILNGAHDAIVDRIGVAAGYWTPIEIEMLENNRETLEAALGSEEFRRLNEVGRSLTSDQLVEFGLRRIELESVIPRFIPHTNPTPPDQTDTTPRTTH